MINSRQLINQLRVAYFMPELPSTNTTYCTIGISPLTCRAALITTPNPFYRSNITHSFQVPFVPFGVVGGRNSLAEGNEYRMQIVGGYKQSEILLCQPYFKFYGTNGLGLASGDNSLGKGYTFVYNEASSIGPWPYSNDFCSKFKTRIFF